MKTSNSSWSVTSLAVIVIVVIVRNQATGQSVAQSQKLELCIVSLSSYLFVKLDLKKEKL